VIRPDQRQAVMRWCDWADAALAAHPARAVLGPEPVTASSY